MLMLISIGKIEDNVIKVTDVVDGWVGGDVGGIQLVQHLAINSYVRVATTTTTTMRLNGTMRLKGTFTTTTTTFC